MKKVLKKIKIEKLTKSNFFDVYGISLLYEKIDLSDKYILSLLLPIAEKYVNITLHAMRCELRYFRRGAEQNTIRKPNERNIQLIEEAKIKNWKKERMTLNEDTIFRFFYEGNWHDGYGGEAWADICKACIEVEKAIKGKYIPTICAAIDYLNDLEHNNALYLKDYCCFDLYDKLREKWECQEEYIFDNCSDGVKELLKFKKE